METTEIINGYTITSKWKNGQRGMTASATRGGKKYFLKKYNKFTLPTEDGMFDAKTIRVKKEEFNDFVSVRREVIRRLKPIAGPGGNIVIPCDNFVDGVHYYEATEFIDGVVPDEEMSAFFASLSSDERMLMMKTAAGALSAVHSAGVIHSDLKLKNIIVVKNSRSNFVAKLIDFDSSYPTDNKKYIGGDDVYCSPELGLFAGAEDEEEQEELVKNISVKTDTFSLGVCFHYYLTQTFPEAVELSDRLRRIKEAKERAGKPVVFMVHQYLLEDCELKLNPEITSVNLKTLIFDMLEKDPEKRPTAMQVLQRLKQSEPTVETPWPEHNITLESSKISADGIVGLKKINDGGAKYEVVFSSGRKRTYTREELVSGGYAKEKFVPRGFGEIWPEHSIVFDVPKLEMRGFVSSTKETLGGKNGYKLYRRDGNGKFFTVENLIGMGYAKRGSEPIVSETPKAEVEVEVPVGGSVEVWPEHSIEFDMEAVSKRGFTSVTKSEKGGVKGYLFTKPDGTQQFIRAEMVVIYRMARKI